MAELLQSARLETTKIPTSEKLYEALQLIEFNATAYIATAPA